MHLIILEKKFGQNIIIIVGESVSLKLIVFSKQTVFVNTMLAELLSTKVSTENDNCSSAVQCWLRQRGGEV